MAIEHLFGYDSIFIAAHPDTRLTESEMLQVVYLMKKLKTGMPIQYVIGKAHFMDLELKVNEHTLIPRPETEELVSWIVNDFITGSSPVILDIGTGSGCIALALKKLIPDANVSGCDISSNALSVASQNADTHDLEIQFIEDDILNPVLIKTVDPVDILVSNPPYVTNAESSALHTNVREFEPHQALFVPSDDGLLFYRHIISFAKEKLNPGGRLYLEINEKFGKEIIKLLEKEGFSEVELRKDLSKKDRMIRARYL